MVIEIEIGAVFDGRYRIDGKLGSGGFATVYNATDLRTNQHVALKLLTPTADGYDARARSRFEREAAVLAGLRSPHTVRLLEFAESPDGLLYIVFELLDGEDLARMLNRTVPFDGGQVRDLLRQLLASLDEAHRAGVLHRDIKPENIRIVPTAAGPRAVLIDFGIARHTDSGAPAITATGELVGTPRYMSPEQLTGQPLGTGSDVYSLGIVCLELLIGRDGLHGGGWNDQLERLHSGYVFPIAGLEEHGPLLNIIGRMTARDPSKRFQSAQAVLHALDEPPAPIVERPSARRSARYAVAAVVVVVACIMVGLSVWFVRDDDAAPPPLVEYRPVPALTEPLPAPPVVAESDVGDVGLQVPGQPGDGCRVPARSGVRQIHGELPAYIPTKYESDRRHPVLVVLHDEGQSPTDLITHGGFRDAADHHRFVVLAPSDGIVPWKHDLPSFARIERFVRIAETYLCLDPERIFILGQGAGGSLASRTPCLDVPWVKGIATHNYSLSNSDFTCDGEPSAAVPSLLLLGTKDSVRPVNGKPTQCPSTKEKLSHQTQIRRFTKRNQCESEPKIDVSSGTRCARYECRTPFEVCETDGGADWPGVRTTRLGPKCSRGPATTFALAERTMAFFARVAVERPQETAPP